MVKCNRCRCQVEPDKAYILGIYPLNTEKPNESRKFQLCEKCRCGILQYILQGDPIQQKCDAG